MTVHLLVTVVQRIWRAVRPKTIPGPRRTHRLQIVIEWASGTDDPPRLPPTTPNRTPRWAIRPPQTTPRHCEERSDEAIQGRVRRLSLWIASSSSYEEGLQW